MKLLLWRLALCNNSVCRVCAEHFRHEHYLCEDHGCLEKKFVVFPSEQEIKQHAAREHGGNMSRAEKRQALTIPINFQVPDLPHSWYCNDTVICMLTPPMLAPADIYAHRRMRPLIFDITICYVVKK